MFLGFNVWVSLSDVDFPILLCPLLVNINSANAEKKINKYVTTLIDAKWKDTPLVLEVAEYLNDENPNLFWRFVDEVSSRSSDFEKSGLYNFQCVFLELCFDWALYLWIFCILFVAKAKDHYDLVISIAEKFLSTAEIAVMKLGLSLRIYSARVEMFSQMAENKEISNLECHNFIDAGGKFTCSVDEIQELMNQVSIN